MSRLDIFEPTRVCNSQGNDFIPTRAGIQAALDDLDSRGGWVYMPPIEIAIDATITVDAPNQGVTLFSDALGYNQNNDMGCVLRLNNGVNDPVIEAGLSGSTNRSLHFRNFAIDGNKSNNSSPTADDNYGLLIHRAEFSVLTNMVIYNCYNTGLQLGQGDIHSKSKVIGGKFSDNGDNGIRTTQQEDFTIMGVHTGSNGTNDDDIEGQAGINCTAQLVNILGCTSIRDQVWCNIRGNRNVISNNLVDKPYQHAMKFHSASEVWVSNLQCHDVSYTNNNSVAFFFNNAAHGQFFFDNVCVEEGGNNNLPTYIFGVNNASSVSHINVGRRHFEYINDIFDAYPTDVWIEPVTELTFKGSADLSNSNTNYWSIDDLFSQSTTESARTLRWPRRKLFSDLYIWLDGSPGAGNDYDFTLRDDGANTSLSVQISDAATSGSDTSSYVEAAANSEMCLMSDPTGGPTARRMTGYIRMNDLEDTW